MFFPKFVYMTKNTPFFPILHVFAPLNDVRAYSAWSWKNNPNYVNFWTSLIPPLTFEWPPGPCMHDSVLWAWLACPCHWWLLMLLMVLAIQSYMIHDISWYTCKPKIQGVGLHVIMYANVTLPWLVSNKNVPFFSHYSPGGGYLVEKWVRGCAAQIGCFFGLSGFFNGPFFIWKLV